jgi:nucleoside 2-deoxyribosyltransferase
MKIYLAGPFTDRDKLQDVADQLKGLGHEITSSWLYGSEQIPESMTDNVKDYVTGKTHHDESWSVFGKIATNDIEDVREADTLVKFHTDDLEYRSGGKFVEMGVALGLGKGVIIVGAPEQVFDWYPTVAHVADVDMLLTCFQAVGIADNARAAQAEETSCPT